jgi:uncharacterized membrane protein YfcA
MIRRKNKMKEKIVGKLLSGKFLMTIAVTFTICYLALTGKVDAKDFMVLATMVAGTYFGQSVAKKVE